MQDYYFTFGYHDHERRQKYVKITASSYNEARRLMFKNYGQAWAFSYTEAEFKDQVAKYQLTELSHITEEK